MASRAARLAHNADGSFFVDSSCIDCDTCRWMAPTTFTRREQQASVARQPEGIEERLRAAMALVSCPTASIGADDKQLITAARDSLPDRIDGPVYHCGYHHEASFGATSYLIVRERGNVLVDSPRFSGPLVRRLEEMGGVTWMFLTHRDDVGDHARFADHFMCERVLHARDVTDSTRDVELQIEGDDPFALDQDLAVIPTPGHTEGSACLLYDERYLFSGDHVAWSARFGHIYAFRSACWYDWGVQIESMRKLEDFPFEWILPGHGRRCYVNDGRMRREIARAVEWMTARAS